MMDERTEVYLPWDGLPNRSLRKYMYAKRYSVQDMALILEISQDKFLEWMDKRITGERQQKIHAAFAQLEQIRAVQSATLEQQIADGVEDPSDSCKNFGE